MTELLCGACERGERVLGCVRCGESAQYHLTRKSTVAPLHRAVTPETEAGLRVAYEPAASVTVTQSMEAFDHDLDTWLPASTLFRSVTKPVVLPPVSQLA